MLVPVAVALAIAVAAIVGLLALHREALRRVLLGTVDPRPLALFRIALGLSLLAYLVEIAPLATYLFSDEGLMPTSAVPQTYGRGALPGHGEGVRSPFGWAVVQHLAHGRWSLLYFWDDPAFVRGTMVTLAIACFGMVIGWHTRLCTIVTWLLLTGLLRRGDAHWGGEQILMGLLFIMMFARSGAAYGVDAWLRARKLARAGQLDLREGELGGGGAPPCSEHPRGLAAIYRRVPAWPQALLIAQLALCYGVNGWTKSGSTWVSGDTLRLAVHLDKYTRLDWHALAVALGPWPFRLATYGVLWWERLFPLLLVGLWLRARSSARVDALRGWLRFGSRLCWLALAGALAIGAWVPGALHQNVAIAHARAQALGAFAGLLVLWVLLGPWIGAWLGHARDRWISRLLAPSWWLGFGLLFHLVSVVLFEIGAFASATVAVYLLCGLGPLAVVWVQHFTRALGRAGLPIPAHLRRTTPVAVEDAALPHLHRDAVAQPGWVIAGAGLIVLLGFILALYPGPRSIAWWHGGWFIAASGLIAVGWHRAARGVSARAAHVTPLAYGPAGRLAAAGLLAYHLVSLVAWQLPPWPAAPWRNDARALLEPWMELSFTRQLWSMFAPNGPRKNTSVRTTVIDGAGVAHDLRTELQHPENLRRPYLRQDRWRKVDESVGGYRPWLALWHARYLCRQWALEHGGEPLSAVRLERVVAPFPPMRPLDAQAWFWEQAKVVPIGEIRCATEPFAQLAPEIRTRHGLPNAARGELRYAWPENPPRSEPLEPLWMLLALTLGGVMAGWARQERARDHLKKVDRLG